jgi:hypothetical protein
MSDAVMKQPKPIGNGAIVWSEVMADMSERVRMGKDKYGTLLRADNGREPLVDAYQEALDLTQYLKQAIIESRKPGKITDLPILQLFAVAHMLADAVILGDITEDVRITAQSVKDSVPVVSTPTLIQMLLAAVQEINNRRTEPS